MNYIAYFIMIVDNVHNAVWLLYIYTFMLWNDKGASNISDVKILK